MEQAHFVSLTFHRVPDDWLAIFRAQIEWLRRRNVQYIWRIEMQRRGAPHWHIILFADDACLLKELAKSWHQRANHDSRAHKKHGFHVRKVDSFRSARAYVSKYIAKVDDRSQVAGTALDGRRCWGNSRNLPTRALARYDLSEAGYTIVKRIARKLVRSRMRKKRKMRYFGAAGLFLHCETSTCVKIWLAIEAHLDAKLFSEVDLSGPRPPPRIFVSQEQNRRAKNRAQNLQLALEIPNRQSELRI